MTIKLIWATPDMELLVTTLARVSSPDSQQQPSEDPKGRNERLLRYLIKNKHWSPFEMVSMCFEIRTTRAISAQILRHRSFSFQEFSQRYSRVDLLGEPPEVDLRYAGTTNRQSSMSAIQKGISSAQHATNLLVYRAAVKASQIAYQTLIKGGVAPESARFVLPLSSPTRLYMAGTLRSWIHYCEIRTDLEHVQQEHAQLALAIQQVIAAEAPTIAAALGWPL